MAGVRIGKAARDGTDIDKVIAGLRSGRSEIILPPAVLQLPEALPHRQWKRSYGPLEERRMMRQEWLIGTMLERWPRYLRLPPRRACMPLPHDHAARGGWGGRKGL